VQYVVFGVFVDGEPYALWVILDGDGLITPAGDPDAPAGWFRRVEADSREQAVSEAISSHVEADGVTELRAFQV
jgi:hypothetical protein